MFLWLAYYSFMASFSQIFTLWYYLKKTSFLTTTGAESGRTSLTTWHALENSTYLKQLYFMISFLLQWFFLNLNLFRVFGKRQQPSLPKERRQLHKIFPVPCIPQKFVQTIQGFRFTKPRRETGVVCSMTSVNILGYFCTK